MRVLFVSAWFPYPPDNGSRIRAYNLIRSLSSRHQVYLVSLLQEDSLRENAEHLSGICEVVSLHESRWFRAGSLRSFLGLFSGKPRSYVDTFVPSVRNAIQKAIREVSPDVIVASQAGSMVYVPADAPAPVVFEEMEVGWMHRQLRNCRGVKRLRRQLTLAKYRSFIRGLLRRADAYTCVSTQERELISRFYDPGITGTVVPNGVDTDYYNGGARNPEPEALVYNGALTYGANLDAVRYFASDIYPILKDRCPRAKLRVTGRTTGVDLRDVEDCPGIVLTGYVDDMRDVLNRSAACVVPLREGGGSRLKILEAMAAGVPVVSTSVGAEGLDCTDGKEILIADAPAEFVEAITRVLTDASVAQELSQNARNLVEQRYSWSMIGDSFVDMVETVACERRRH